MLRRLIKYFLLGLVLLLVCLASALLAMRFAIRVREVRVPQFQGLTPAEAERLAGADGLVLSVEGRFYSPEIPAGRIISQSPPPTTKVRRGWKVRVAESLGPQRASIPNVLGQSERVAELIITRRGLEIGTVAVVHSAGAAPSSVIAQSPAPDAHNAVSPKIGLIVTAADHAQAYIMPSFVGKSLAEASTAIKQAGFMLGKINLVEEAGPSGTIARQVPAAGQKITAGAMISLDVRK